MSQGSYTSQINCKGRNGWFKFHKHQVYSWKIGTASVVLIDVHSKQKGKEAPVVIGGPQDKIIALLELMLAEARKEAS